MKSFLMDARVKPAHDGSNEVGVGSRGEIRTPYPSLRRRVLSSNELRENYARRVIRTPNLTAMNGRLCQLSYAREKREMVWMAGFDPAASCARGMRSARLSYTQRLNGALPGFRSPLTRLTTERPHQQPRSAWCTSGDSNTDPSASRADASASWARRAWWTPPATIRDLIG